MLKHGRAGVPLEVMGLMLGSFEDEFTVRVIGQSRPFASEDAPLPEASGELTRRLAPSDVFAMPQSGTGVSVEAVDPVFQTKMIEMLKQTGRCALAVSRFSELAHADAHSRALAGQKWWLDGTTRTRASDAGSRASMSTPNKCVRGFETREEAIV